MTTEQIVMLVTILVTYVMGKLAKKFKWLFEDYIPFQNLLIGFFAGLIAYIAGLTDNVVISILSCMLSAFGAGGIYDLKKVGAKNDK